MSFTDYTLRSLRALGTSQPYKATHRDKFVAQSSRRTLLRKDSMAPAAVCGSTGHVSCTVTLQNVVLIGLYGTCASGRLPARGFR